MSEEHKNEIIRNLRNYAIQFDDDTIEQYLLIIEIYKGKDLKKMFDKQEDISLFLEDFLVRCYQIRLYMENHFEHELEDISTILQGDIGAEMFNALFGYYGWFSQMALYFNSLNINSVSKSYYEAFKNVLNSSENMRYQMCNINIDDPVYKVLIANFIDVFTSQIEQQHEEIMDSCLMSIMDNNILELEEDFINYNENRLKIYSTNDKTYDKIIRRITNTLEDISEDIDYIELVNLVRYIVKFRRAQDSLETEKKSLQRVLEMNSY